MYTCEKEHLGHLHAPQKPSRAKERLSQETAVCTFYLALIGLILKFLSKATFLSKEIRGLTSPVITQTYG